MSRLLRRRFGAGACLAGLVLMSTGAARGQEDGFRLHGHLGIGQVEALLDRDDLDRTGVGPLIGLGADWPLSGHIRLGAELERHRFLEGAPDEGQPFAGLDGVLGTTVLLAAVEIRVDRFYLRPGVGFSHHRFGTGRESGGRIVFAGTSGEAGEAAGLALGARLGRSGPLTFLVEAVARWTDGEDSTSGRRLVALTAGAALYP